MNFKLRKLSENKRGILGGFLGMFVATIVVVVILLIFVILSGVVKLISGDKEGVAIRDLQKTGISNIYTHMNDFVKLIEVKFYLTQEKNLNQAIQEANYEK